MYQTDVSEVFIRRLNQTGVYIRRAHQTDVLDGRIRRAAYNVQDKDEKKHENTYKIIFFKIKKKEISILKFIYIFYIFSDHIVFI